MELLFSVDEPASPPHFQVGVPPSASSGSGEALAFSWASCGRPVVNDSAPLTIDISPPVSIEASVVWLQKPGADEVPTALAPPGDSVTSVPFVLPTAASLAVQVTYAAGNRRAFENDDRLELETWPPGCANASTRPARVTLLDGAECTELTVVASVSVGAARVSTSIAIPVARLHEVTLQRTACPPGASELDTLRPIACSGIYQTSQLMATAVLSTGSSRDVTRFATWSSSDAAVLRVECLNGCAPHEVSGEQVIEPYHAVPQSAGRASVFVYFDKPRHNTTVDFAALDEHANVSHVAVSMSSSVLPTSHYGFGTFSTVTDVTFDDGSFIDGLESFTCGARNTDTFVLGARLVTPQIAWPAPASTGLGKQGGSDQLLGANPCLGFGARSDTS